MWASKEGHIDVVRTLLAAGADKEAHNNQRSYDDNKKVGD